MGREASPGGFAKLQITFSGCKGDRKAYRKEMTPTQPTRSSSGFLDRTRPPHVITLVLIAGLAAMSMNIFLPSMPSMAIFFEADYALIQLAVSAYLALTGLLNIVLGPLSDRYGRRNVLMGSMAVFCLASIGCMLSTSIEMFLACRMAQAVVASGMVLSRAIVRDMVSPDRAASMIAYVTMGMALVPMLAPVVGGLLEAQFGWQANFLAMALSGAFVLWLTYADLAETNTAQTTSFKAQFAAYPELLRSRRFWGYTFVAGVTSGAFFAFLGGAPYVGSEILGLSPRELGIYFGIIPTGYLIGNFFTGRFASRLGIGFMILAGGFVATGGMLLVLGLWLSGVQTAIAFFGGVFFVGLGNGLTMPSATSGLLSVKPELAGSASGLGTATMIGLGALLSATAGALLGPTTGAWPLILIMLACGVSGIILARYTNKVEAEEAANRTG